MNFSFFFVEIAWKLTEIQAKNKKFAPPTQSMRIKKVGGANFYIFINILSNYQPILIKQTNIDSLFQNT